jgi:hypothetical protein
MRRGGDQSLKLKPSLCMNLVLMTYLIQISCERQVDILIIINKYVINDQFSLKSYTLIITLTFE